MPRKPISFELDFMIKDIFPRFAVKQFDDVSFNIKPKNQGLDYDITGTTGKIFVGVNNDMFMQTDGITVSSNNINVLLDKNMLQKNGRAYAEIELTDSAGTITSSSFIFDIDPKIGEGGQIPGEYEGFVEKYERLISEFKSQVSSTINNCNNKVNITINNCNTNVDNKLNSVDSLVNVKISDFEKRFNRLTSSQQQDAEVIDARVDFKGVAFDSLKERIDCTDKLLRDSTVSTIETESDFTTVEATSNGYFEDVKLEGKTLVNLWGNKSSDFTLGNHVSFSNNKITYSSTDTPTRWNNFFAKNLNILKTNTEYTIVTYVIKNELTEGTIYINNTSSVVDGAFGESESIKIQNGVTGIFINKLTSKSEFPSVNTVGIRSYIDNTMLQPNISVELQIIILESDHTQNPPEYFEGLKSVGQSASEDGADEIVVSSVKGDGNLFNSDGLTYGRIGSLVIGKYYNEVYLKSNNAQNRVIGLPVRLPQNSNLKFYFKCEGYQIAHTFFDENLRLVRDNSWHSNDIEISPRDKEVYVATYIKRDDGTIMSQSDIDYIKRNAIIVAIDSFENISYTPHQSDKKRLLYYNEETQTWEKPVLREWDSIEKHSNGKYYYHKRSGEAVLNGEEFWELRPVSDSQDVISFNGSGLKTSSNVLGVVCDKFITMNAFGEDSNFENIFIATSTRMQVRILKSKLSTQDVAGFKAWLQANPTTVVYQLEEEKVYECTNIDLITYNGETNYVVESGAIVPKTTLKVHNNISNVVSLLQKKVSLLESNVKASQEVQDMMILETDMRMLDIELALMDFVPMTLNLGGSNMLRSATYFNFLKNHIINETYEKEYLENVMNKYLATGRINQDEYNELYKMLYPPVYDIELPI